MKIKINAGAGSDSVGGLPVFEIDGIDFSKASRSLTLQMGVGQLTNVEVEMYTEQLNAILSDAQLKIVATDPSSGNEVVLEAVVFKPRLGG